MKTVANDHALAALPRSRPGSAERASRRVFFGILALLFMGSVWMTVIACSNMPMQNTMSMPGGWSMSMTWMRMPGQTWLRAAAAFLSMWVWMMVAMMLPSLAPVLWRYRQAISGASGRHQNRLTLLAGLGYFYVWTVFGLAVFVLGSALTHAQMQLPWLARIVPIGTAGIVMLAGALQFTAWKSRHLACCRAMGHCHPVLPTTAYSAWQAGIRLGLHCCHCCAGLTLILLVLGVMELGIMAVITIAITTERLAPASARVAHIIGVIALGAGLWETGQAIGGW